MYLIQGNTSHKAWDISKSLIDRDNKNLKQNQNAFLFNNQLTKYSNIIANALNDYFVNICSTYQQTLFLMLIPV